MKLNATRIAAAVSAACFLIGHANANTGAYQLGGMPETLPPEIKLVNASRNTEGILDMKGANGTYGGLNSVVWNYSSRVTAYDGLFVKDESGSSSTEVVFSDPLQVIITTKSFDGKKSIEGLNLAGAGVTNDLVAGSKAKVTFEKPVNITMTGATFDFQSKALPFKYAVAGSSQRVDGADSHYVFDGLDINVGIAKNSMPARAFGVLQNATGSGEATLRARSLSVSPFAYYQAGLSGVESISSGRGSKSAVIVDEELSVNATSDHSRFVHGLVTISQQEGVSGLEVGGATQININAPEEVVGVIAQSSGYGSQSSMLFNDAVGMVLDARDGAAVGVHSENTGGKVDLQFRNRLHLDVKGGHDSTGIVLNGANSSMTGLRIEEGLGLEAGRGILVDGQGDSSIGVLVSGPSKIKASKGPAVSVAGNESTVTFEGGANAPLVINGSLEGTNGGKLSAVFDTEESEFIGDAKAYSGSTMTLVFTDGAKATGGFDNGLYDTGALRPGLAPGRLDITAGTKALINLNRNSSVSNMALKEARVVIPRDGSLDVGSLTGDGVFAVEMDASRGADRRVPLFVHEALEGDFAFDLTLDNQENDPEAVVGTVLARVNGEQGKGRFVVKDVEKDLYWERLELSEVKNDQATGFARDWMITSVKELEPGRDVPVQAPDPEVPVSDVGPKEPAPAVPVRPTPLGDTLVSTRLAAFAQWNDLVVHDTLSRRLGDLRLNPAGHVEGLWMRTRHAKARLKGDLGLDMKLHHYELGYDRAFRNEDSVVYWGGSLNWEDDKATLTRGSSKVESLGLGLYRTELFDNGVYWDAIVRANRQKNRFSALTSEGEVHEGRLRQWAWSGSLELGRRYEFDNRFFLEPQGQVVYGYLPGDEVSTSKGMKMKVSRGESLVTRAGLVLGRSFDDARGDVHVQANVLSQWLGRNTVELSNNAQRVRLTDKSRGTWGELGVGGSYAFTKRFAVSGSADWTLRNHWGRNFTLNVNASYRF